MQLTSIKRAYYFNRVAYKSKLPQKYIFPLFTIFLIQPAGYTAIDLTLSRVKRSHSGAQLLHVIKYLVNSGYIIKDINKKYSLTTAGLSLLKDIESRLRKERYDK